jgi:uncharacterized protein (DUF924 family)
VAKPYERILSFWFGDSPAETKERAARWWKKDPIFDQEVRAEFEADLLRATRGELDGWLDEPAGAVAYVVLLDQFSRNMYRDTPQAFEQDGRALSATLSGMDRGVDTLLPPVHRYFFYMPMMHAEDRAIQAARWRRSNNSPRKKTAVSTACSAGPRISRGVTARSSNDSGAFRIETRYSSERRPPKSPLSSSHRARRFSRRKLRSSAPAFAWLASHTRSVRFSVARPPSRTWL